MKVLTVDDNPMTGLLLQDTLTDLGHQGFIAEDAEQAMSLFEREQPQVCIVDWMMPKVDGLQLACSIRQHRLGPGVYIIMLSAKGELENISLAYELGIDEFIMKPVASGELKARLRTAARLVTLHEQYEEKCREVAALRADLALQRPAA